MRENQQKRGITDEEKFFYLIGLIILAGTFSLFVGVSDLTLRALIAGDEDQIRIFLVSRLPRMISVLCVGMTASIAGVIMQQVTGNPFVSPATASTMDWAKLGVLVAILLFPSQSVGIKVLIAFIFSFAGSLLFVQMIKAIKLKDTVLIPLIGMMLGSVISSVTTFIAYKYDLVQNVTSWLQGSFAMILQGRYELLYFGIPVLFLSFLYADRFTIASFGEDIASNLGVSYNFSINVGLILASLVTSITVTTVGMIPFIGVIVPNVVRIYRGDHLRENIWEIALVGGLFLLVCDIFSRLIIYPFEVPISVTVSVIGAVVFLYLLLRRKTDA